jgi:hypothetical protein
VECFVYEVAHDPLTAHAQHPGEARDQFFGLGAEDQAADLAAAILAELGWTAACLLRVHSE